MISVLAVLPIERYLVSSESSYPINEVMHWIARGRSIVFLVIYYSLCMAVKLESY